jgi:mono/diheme cytochrome c family protein
VRAARRGLALGTALLCLAVAAPRGALPEPSNEQLSRGRVLYERHCATCHRPAGEAPVLTREQITPMGTAQGLFDFVRVAMPQNAPGSLAEQEYWDILAYLLAETGVTPSGARLGPDTAAGLRLAP